MKAVLKGLLICAVGLAMPLSTTPASAQMSPAQLKAQKDRAAREAAARTEAARERSAAEANARAQARQAALKEESARIAEARKNAALLAARQQAVQSGKITNAWATGVWAFDSLLSCSSDLTYNFQGNGSWSHWGEKGTWTISGGSIVYKTTEIWEMGEEAPKEKGDLAISSLIPIRFEVDYFTVEGEGGDDIYFRCPLGIGYDTILNEYQVKYSKRIDLQEKFHDATKKPSDPSNDVDLDFGEYDQGLKLWNENSFFQSRGVFEAYMRMHPWGYRRSYVRNFLGIFYRDHEVDLPRAAEWFLQNYQVDPGGDRAADSLLSLAEVMKKLGDERRYCIALRQFVSDYPLEAEYRLKDRFNNISGLVTCQ